MLISIKIPTLETEHLMYDPVGTFQTNTQYSSPVCKRFSSIGEYKMHEIHLKRDSIAPVAQNAKLGFSPEIQCKLPVK